MAHMKNAPAPEESVVINVVPLVDIMFLLLLFFMLGADMSHRESVELMLPEADKAVDQKTEVGEARYTIINIHMPKDMATEAERRDEANWAFAIAGKDFPDYFSLVDELKVIADQKREPTPQPGSSPPLYLSAVTATVRADKAAPYGMIQQAMQACSAVGLYMIEVGAAKPPEK